ncbi:hypothetical protein BTN50_1441 [Candidatus Enterovibrio altilux]|uniref:Mobile element protein n=1 Tax=Candidatus Enterovibrio altilux TaxID=1927128 RepID=A0A291BAA6_9GAMM|nr:hypothetical protein BTN50_1441 [Candidatus Enterovibrio luxaltus]
MEAFVYSVTLDITMSLMIKCIFPMSLKNLQRLVNFIFKFTQLPLSCMSK